MNDGTETTEGAGEPEEILPDLIPQLVVDGYLAAEGEDGGVLRLTEKAAALIAFVFENLTMAEAAALALSMTKDLGPLRAPVLCPSTEERK